MKKIAILACRNSNQVCACCACLNAFYDRQKSFECYAGEEIRLTAFMRCSKCHTEVQPMEEPGFLEKLERLVSKGTECIHIGICAMKNDEACPGMAQMAKAFEDRGIEVIWGTH
ncbi:MAG: CGGC domain-containing protein [Clostridia bacterium]|nr:CGGC domain-containing protein [Clostridia bacterium]